MRYLSALAIVWGSVIAVCLVFAVQTPRAEAQTSTYPPGAAPGVNWADDVSTKEEIFRLKKLWAQPARPEAARNITTNAARSQLPLLSRGLITRGGLAGIAAGVWIHNGVMLYNQSQCGDVYCPPPLIMDVEFRQAMQSADSSGAGGTTFKATDSSGVVVGAGMVTGASYSVSSQECRVSIQWATQGNQSPTSRRFGRVLLQPSPLDTAGNGCTSRSSAVTTGTEGADWTGAAAPAGAVRYGQFRTVDSDGYGGAYFGPVFDLTRGMSWENPVFDWGEATEVQQAPTTTHEFGPQQSTQFANQVGSEGCPVGIAPAVAPAPEVCPDYFPEEWEEEFPDVGQPGRQDDPYGDPDEDGQPNHSDPDDDGDEVPDEDDPQPYVNPNAPTADPDEDGQPNENDPDDDNDGIPDEDDPKPTTPTAPTTLPQDHPYSDPDEDGQPNRDDQDDDGDGIPDESDPEPHEPTEEEDLPLWHPFADPDADGSRNGADKDDDGDESEDWEDERPFSPAFPSDPDRDTDDDGTPDWSDPWPGNPWSPHDPERDDDEDGVPDYKDPDPDRDNVPWGPWPDPDDDPDDPPDRRDRPEDDPDTGSGTPWRHPDTGTPNVPTDPPNTAYPPGSPTTTNPPDQSTGIENPPPSSSDTPDDPTTETPNDPPTDGGGGVPPSGPSLSCPVERKPPAIIVPPVNFEEKFPFSLVLGAMSVLDQLSGTPQAPSFDLPMLGTVNLSRFDGAMATIRVVFLVLIGGILMPLMFFRLIRGGGE